MFYYFFKKIASATPYKNVVLWALYSIVYALLILINEHFELIEALGLSPRTLSIIKVSGVYLYIAITTYQFHKQKNRPS
jgi:hypothetical protein